MLGQVVIDGIEFARAGRTLTGQLEVSSMARVQDSLVSGEGTIDYTVNGGQNPHGRPLLRVIVKGTLNLRCQRCLGPYAFPVDICTDLLLLREESEFADVSIDADDTVDGILATPKMDVAAMVEDEIILAIPYAPLHPQGVCEVGGGTLSERGGALQTRSSPA
jgi:DUF177 domain-containing protein